MSRIRSVAFHWLVLIAVGALVYFVLPSPPAAPRGKGKGGGSAMLATMGLAGPGAGPAAAGPAASPAGEAGPPAGKARTPEGKTESPEKKAEAPEKTEEAPSGAAARVGPASPAEKLLWSLLSLVLAALLGALIAYHPAQRPRMGIRMEDVETPQMRILVSVAAAVIIMVVLYEWTLAFAIFGLSGFVRVFRARLKSANEIAMILLCACIGMIAGTQQFTLAVTTTAFVWILLWLLGMRTGGGMERLRVTIRGLDEEARTMAPAFREALEGARVAILSSRVNIRKGNVSFVIRKPAKLSVDRLNEALAKVEGRKPKSITWEGGEEESA